MAIRDPADARRVVGYERFVAVTVIPCRRPAGRRSPWRTRIAILPRSGQEVVRQPHLRHVEPARIEKRAQLCLGVLAEVSCLALVLPDRLVRITAREEPEASRERGRVRRLQHERPTGSHERREQAEHVSRRRVQVLDDLRADDDVVRIGHGPLRRVVGVVEIEVDMALAVSRRRESRVREAERIDTKARIQLAYRLGLEGRPDIEQTDRPSLRCLLSPLRRLRAGSRSAERACARTQRTPGRRSVSRTP